MLNLSADEQEQLSEYECRRHGDRAWLSYYTVPVMIDIWATFASELNQRDWNADDYVGAGLQWREYLGDVLEQTKPPLRTELEKAIQTIDRKFCAATEPDEQDLLGKFFRGDYLDAAWWRQRIPKSGPIRQHLERA